MVDSDGVDEGFGAEVVGGELGSHCHDRDREEIHGAIVLEAMSFLAISVLLNVRNKKRSIMN